MPQGYFITGTDTGVGKTYFACALARSLCKKNLKVGVMKPVETGCSPVETGCSPNEDGLLPLVPHDALALKEAASSEDPIELICPYTFALPVAPSVAARAKGVEVELEKIKESFVNIASGKDVMVVEGAGGLLVPIGENKTMANLALALGLPLIVVAPSRLGCINSALLTVKAAESTGLKVRGVILNHTTPEGDESTPHNRGELEGFGIKVLGDLEFSEETTLPKEILKALELI